jgi:hypothetical protein
MALKTIDSIAGTSIWVWLLKTNLNLVEVQNLASPHFVSYS